MDKEAINTIIKGIKEGARALTPLAKEYVHQVQMQGVVKIIVSFLPLVILILISALVVKMYKNSLLIEKDNYSGKNELSGLGIATIFIYGSVAVILLIISIGLFANGLGQAVAPLPYIIGR
ncbi:Protein of unknown function [Leuconostoc citreum LBAE E16]|uniref:hypothetical protein n=1 Tax=Leuconostoc citreum TaxID=33964 RepID=UPI000246611F|nr:hypothetical protein [Leuconostoc citreum]CCF28046.1 Protein of unknown function [Leuconostoc citreum LBAE E16]